MKIVNFLEDHAEHWDLPTTPKKVPESFWWRAIEADISVFVRIYAHGTHAKEWGLFQRIFQPLSAAHKPPLSILSRLLWYVSEGIERDYHSSDVSWAPDELVDIESDIWYDGRNRCAIHRDLNIALFPATQYDGKRQWFLIHIRGPPFICGILRRDLDDRFSIRTYV